MESPPELPTLPSSPLQHIRSGNSNTAAVPSPTSELSDPPNTTPSISDEDEEVEDEEMEDEEMDDEDVEDEDRATERRNETVAAETQRFWRARRRRGFNFEHFMEGWLLGRMANNRQRGSRLVQFIRVLKKPSIRERLAMSGIRFELNEEDRKLVDVPATRKELSEVMKKPAFGKFEPDQLIGAGDGLRSVKDVYKDVGWLESPLQNAWPQLQEAAPKIGAALESILANQRDRQKPDGADEDNASFSREARAYMIVTLLLGAYASNRTNFLPFSLGMYLHSNGVPRRVVDTLARFGICPGYRAIVKQIDLVAKQPRVRTGSPGSAPTSGPATTSGLMQDIA
ncbi:hypothetical protein K449DRAFT_402313 [Hypoxylon sp. EC38]|nr:hypothetical protein K449DRAFT_402313 [Hypoxylon sp. EC38]